MKQNKDIIFLVGGMTGGPIMPLLSYLQFLPEYKYIIIGVKNGFEEAVAKNRKLDFIVLPKAKQNIYNTRGVFVFAKMLEILRYVKIALQLSVSILLAAYYLLKYRPTAVVSAGGFLTVPIHFALKVVKMLKVKPKLIIHQQDVVPTKSNIIAANSADLLSVAWEKTRKENKKFAHALLIPNLLETERFEERNILQSKEKLRNSDSKLFDFLFYTQKNAKPLLFVYGGGSGAQYINELIWEYKKVLLGRFRILHITGVGKQKEGDHETDYLQYQQLIGEAQDLALLSANIIVSRAGMGAITEIKYLDKTSFILPIPFSHQLDNAEAVNLKRVEVFLADSFEYKQHSPLHQGWIDRVMQAPLYKSKTDVHYVKELTNYFQKVHEVLSTK